MHIQMQGACVLRIAPDDGLELRDHLGRMALGLA